MAPGRAVLVLLVVLVLSPPRVCGAALEPGPGQPQGGQWLWGAARRALPLSRGKRDDGEQDLGATAATPGHSHAATALISSDQPKGGSVPPPAPGTNASLLQVPTTADPVDETDSPDPDLLLSSAPPPAVPGSNVSLLWALTVSTTADPMDETDSPNPDQLLSSAPPSPSTNTSLNQALTVPARATPMDETDSPDPDQLLSSAPPSPSTNASLNQALTVPATAAPMDETDSPDPDLLLGPGTSAAPQRSISTTPSWLTPPGKEGTVAGGTDSTSSTGPPSTAPPTLGPTTTGYGKVKKAGAPPAPTRSAPGDTTPTGTAVPWDPSGVMGKCLLAILLLGLVAATFLVSTGVLGALLWRRARTGHRRLSRTEMVCISSLLADAEAAAGPRPVPARRHKRLHDGSAEPDGDNLTLSSFLPEQS
ncbi:PREDICTED: P-selectin glycoprotein ligand 1 [Lepidothrix coronata]|uniref:P-selectin glycoprotein ligand 1 n=1 Tax=Lepidothrix coronata TaxID=321398 RepID=A0A6J0H5R9_9PASS|nr:PREDICTED: P-selectin glycoprotein ligand 1 [Lepidothrix coronata]